MPVTELNSIYFFSSVMTLSVALSLWLFFRWNAVLHFVIWALGFVLLGGYFASHFLWSLFDWSVPLLDWGEQVLLGSAGTCLVLGSWLGWKDRFPTGLWLGWFALPVWAAIGWLSSWSLLPFTLVNLSLLILGYLGLAYVAWRQFCDEAEIASGWLSATTVCAALSLSIGLLPETGMTWLWLPLAQLFHLAMAVAFLLILLAEQRGRISRALAGEAGALERVTANNQHVSELDNWTGLLLRQVSDGVAICDEKGYVISFNKAAEHLFGLDHSEMTGRPIRQLFTPESWHKLVTAGERNGPFSAGHHELEGVHRNGTTLSLDVSMSALNIGGNLQGMVILRDITARKRQEERLGFYASHDALTGLINRRSFESELQNVLNASQAGWLVFLNLDDFKMVNEAFGHQAGDAALVALARRLRASLREDALVARYSGDEFVVFVPESSSWEESPLIAAVNLLLQRPIATRGMEFRLSGSMGVVRIPEHGDSLETLLRNANLAMFEAKRQGKNKAFLFNDELGRDVGLKADIATRLKSIVPDQQLAVYFQPRVGLPDRNLCGAEALVRWVLPDGSFVSPEIFIPVAEDTGQILRIGYWVMEETCRLLAGWTGYQDPFVVSINLSPRQLFDEQLVERIEGLRLRYGLAASQLEFEITESSAMQNPDYAIKVLLRLRALGYGLSMDDFGTGFSSLSQLRRLPVNVLKIDQSFVRNMHNDRQDRVMVAAIIELAGHLGLTVLAEGVETDEQFKLLDALGCNEIQGYLVSKPVPADRFAEKILKNWNQFSRTIDW